MELTWGILSISHSKFTITAEEPAIAHVIQLNIRNMTSSPQVYWKDEHEKFPAGGKLSQWLAAQEIGSMVEAKGPVGHFHYLGMGRCALNLLSACNEFHTKFQDFLEYPLKQLARQGLGHQ